ncbi:hypothetical protein pb186bvf_011339 [Paramecium bursaria]
MRRIYFKAIEQGHSFAFQSTPHYQPLYEQNKAFTSLKGLNFCSTLPFNKEQMNIKTKSNTPIIKASKQNLSVSPFQNQNMVQVDLMNGDNLPNDFFSPKTFTWDWIAQIESHFSS